jgi:hypothetical protein
MNTIELKKSLHNLIDRIDNEQLLTTFYDLMKKKAEAKEGLLWNRLTDQEREELLMTVEESEDPDNLIDHRQMKEKHKKWL